MLRRVPEGALTHADVPARQGCVSRLFAPDCARARILFDVAEEAFRWRNARPMRTTVIASSIIFFSAAFACGGSTAQQPDAGNNEDAGQDPDATPNVVAGPDVDNGAVSTTYPAFTVDAPQVVTGGGPTLVAPKLVPVYFGNDDTTFTAQLTTFMNKLGASAFWLPAVGEYGVGAITSAAPIQLTDTAPQTIDDADIQTWIASKIDDATLPAPDANTIYAIYYPDGTTVTLGQQGGTSCQDFGAYHDNITYKGNDVAYAVMPRCSGWGPSVLDTTTSAASHEFIEAATDPYPQTNGAYTQVDDDHILWEFVLGGGETGDMCAQFAASYVTPSDLGFMVQRAWSNASAKAGHDPCQPADKSPYFNSMPVLKDKISIGGGTTKGVHIPIGSSATIDVELFSDADTGGPWTVSATDTSGAGAITFDWDRTSGQNGEKLHLTINAVKKTQYGASGFIIKSKLNGRTTSWFGLVGN